MAEEKKNQNTNNESTKSDEIRHDGINESRHANFTLQSSGTQPLDVDRMLGRPQNSNKDNADNVSGKTK